MKKIVLIISFIVLGGFYTLDAQSPISFRSNALGGIVDDDLDLIYDPIELRFVDGIRLYTNLSNLTSSNEKLFENESDDELLIGMSTQNPLLRFWWTSALLRFQNSQTSNPVEIDSDLDGWNDLYGNGTLVDEYTAYLDTDYDGLYDLKKLVSQKKTDLTTDDSYSFILNNAFKIWILTLGVKLSKGDATYTGTTASSWLGSGHGVLSSIYGGDPTLTRSITSHLFDEDYDNLIWSEGGDFNSSDQIAYTRLAVSAMLMTWDFEIRGDIEYFGDKTRWEANDSYDGDYEYFDPIITSYDDRYSEDDSYMSRTEEDGGGAVFGGSIRDTFSEQDERKNDGYWKFGASVSLGSYDYNNVTKSQFASSETYFDGTDTLSTDFEMDVTKSDIMTDVGTSDVSGHTFFGRANFPLRKKVYLGIGGFLNHSDTNRKTDFTESFTRVTDYTRNDTLNTNDYLTTETSQLTADRTYEVSTTTFTVPVGLEYRLGEDNSWSLRFGAIFKSTTWAINDAKQITDSEPYITETQYDDGDVIIDIDDNIYESTSEQTTTRTSTTLFTYGIGYNPTDNLQIDLLGIGSDDLEFDGIRLSFTMKF